MSSRVFRTERDSMGDVQIPVEAYFGASTARAARDVVHPNHHVNIGQSSNHVIPTAIHLTALLAIREVLVPGLDRLLVELDRQAKLLWDVIKTGLTPEQVSAALDPSRMTGPDTR